MVDVTRIIESAVRGQTLPLRKELAKDAAHKTQEIVGTRNPDGTLARPGNDGFTAGDAAVIGVAAATGGVGLVAAPLVKKFVNGLFGDKPLDGGELAGKAKTGLSDLGASVEGVATDGKRRLQKLGDRAAEAVTPAAAASAPAAAPAASVGSPEPTIGQKISGWFSETFGGAKTAVTGAAASVATAATMATASPPPEPPAAPPVAAAETTAPAAAAPPAVAVEPVVVRPVVSTPVDMAGAWERAADATPPKAKVVIALDQAGFDRAKADGAAAYSIEGHDRYKQAIDALSKGGKLDKFQDQTLNELAATAGIDRKDLDAQFQKKQAVAPAAAAPSPAP